MFCLGEEDLNNGGNVDSDEDVDSDDSTEYYSSLSDLGIVVVVAWCRQVGDGHMEIMMVVV